MFRKRTGDGRTCLRSFLHLWSPRESGDARLPQVRVHIETAYIKRKSTGTTGINHAHTYINIRPVVLPQDLPSAVNTVKACTALAEKVVMATAANCDVN